MNIYYCLYNDGYVARTQGKCMAHVFQTVILKHIDKLPMLFKNLSCISNQDYGDANVFGKSFPEKTMSVSSEFRNSYTFYVQNHCVCVATSSGWEYKKKNMRKLLSFCGEDESVLEFYSLPLGNEQDSGEQLNVYRAPKGLMRYRLFGESYKTTQADFMIKFFTAAFALKPESVKWAMENLHCVSETDYTFFENRKNYILLLHTTLDNLCLSFGSPLCCRPCLVDTGQGGQRGLATKRLPRWRKV